PFAGWEMPISYAGTLAEHTAVRERIGLFDVTHLGAIGVRGEGSAALLDRVLSNRITTLEPGRARYTLILDDDAGIVDDIIVYAFLPGEFLVVPNASNVDEVERRLKERAPGTVGIAQLLRAKVAVQGPRSREVLTAVLPDAPDLGFMRCATVADVGLARSGYTGEHGYEVFSTAERAPALWDALLAAARGRGGEPCGLAARDTLRLEMGYPLHGNDIDTTTTPREARLDWAVAASKDDFVGKAAFESRPPRKELVGLRMEDRVIPRRGATVELGGRTIGTVTSGTFSPTLKLGIALAYIEPAGSLAEGDRVDIVVRGKRGKAHVAHPPFVGSSPK
ncbi:MAG: glycine cleavage system aminomethyltransferase GcvT, partial [Actinomycetota bacterium]